MVSSNHTTSPSENFSSVPVQELQVLNSAWAFSTSRTMSYTMQDFIDQGLSWNFSKAMAISKDGSLPVFLENNYDVHFNYELEIQEHMQHSVAFHAQMMGDIITCIKP